MKINAKLAFNCWASLSAGNILAYWLGWATESQMIERIIFQGIAIIILAHSSLINTQENSDEA